MLFAAGCAQAVAAQPRPAEVAVHVAAPIYFEAERHVGGAVSWRRYSGEGSVPYVVLGAAGVFCTTRYTYCRQVDFMLGDRGVGLTEWSEDRRFFVAPEARFLIDANLKLSRWSSGSRCRDRTTIGVCEQPLRSEAPDQAGVV